MREFHNFEYILKTGRELLCGLSVNWGRLGQSFLFWSALFVCGSRSLSLDGFVLEALDDVHADSSCGFLA